MTVETSSQVASSTMPDGFLATAAVLPAEEDLQESQPRARPVRAPRPATAQTSPEVSTRGPSFQESLLWEGPTRQSVWSTHPLTTDDIQIATPAVKEVYRIVYRAVMKRLPGTNFAGAPRIGKGVSRKLVAKMLAVSFPKIPIGQVVALDHEHSSETKLWTDVAEALGLPVVSSRDVARTRNKVISAILTMCATLESNMFVMFADEVQNWSEKELSLLKDLTNLLDAKGIRLVFIGFGHQNLHEIKSKLRRSERDDLIGRFLKTIHPMQGVMMDCPLISVFQGSMVSIDTGGV